MKFGRLLPLFLTLLWIAPRVISAENPEQAPSLDEIKLEIEIAEEIESLKESLGPLDEEAQKGALRLTREGVMAHDARDYEKAIDLYREALGRDPLNELIHYELGMTLSALGEQMEALKSTLRALAINPQLMPAHMQRAAILDDLGYFNRALAVYDTLLQVMPDDLMVHLNRGITLARIGRLEESEAAFRKTLALDPDHPSAYLHLARFAHGRQEPEEEETLLMGFLERSDGDPRRPAVEERLQELRASFAEAPETSETFDTNTSTSETTTDDRLEINAKDLPSLILLLLTESPLSYEIGMELNESDAAKFRQAEGRRFRDGLDLGDGESEVCGSFQEDLFAVKNAYSAKDSILDLLRCHPLDTEDWERLRKVARGMNLTIRSLPFQPKIRIRTKKKKILVRTDERWMFYGLTKAALRYEKNFAAQLGIETPGEPTVKEEEIAVLVLAYGYLNSREDNKNAENTEPIARDPLLEDLALISSNESLLRGYVLFEIMHQQYGLGLRSLSPTDAAAVDHYLQNFVVLTSPTGS